MMKISEGEQAAIVNVLYLGDKYGYGNLISHLQTAWAQTLMRQYNMPEAAARAASGGRGYPFKMQDDLITRGEWDETGASYQPAAALAPHAEKAE